MTSTRRVLGFLDKLADEYGEDIQIARHRTQGGHHIGPMRYNVNTSAAAALRLRAQLTTDVTDDDIAFLREAEEEDAEFLFDQWYANQFDMTTPSGSMAAQECGDGFFARQEARLNANLEMAKRLAKIKMFGCRTEEDWIIKFGMEHDYFGTPDAQFWYGELGSEFTPGGNYERGFLAPRRSLPGARNDNRADTLTWSIRDAMNETAFD